MAVASLLLCAIFAAGGLVCLWCALTDDDWLFSSTASFLSYLPRGATRVLAVLIGIAVLTIAGIIFYGIYPSLFRG